MKKIHPSVFLAFSLSMVLLISGCAPASTPVLLEPRPTNPSRPTSAPELTNPPEATTVPEQRIIEVPLTIAEVEALAGFEVKEPMYLPAGVSLDFATYDDRRDRYVTLVFKIVHEEYGDMGRFFLISQEPQAEAPREAASCGEMVEGCEILQIGDMAVVYHLYASPETGGDTEGFEWYADGFSFWLLRVAGEPDKIYKDELMKVVGSMK